MDRYIHTVAFALCWILLLLGILLAACNRQVESNPQQPAADHPLSAMKQDVVAASLPDFEAMPQYDIAFTLNDDLAVLQGSATIRVPNSSPDPWTFIIFRLYPTLHHYGGQLSQLSIQSATADGKAVPFSYLEQNTAVRVELPRALLSGQTMPIYLSWRLNIPQWRDDTPASYRLFGHSQGIVSLPLFYPSLGVYQPGPTPSSGRWWLERGTSRGDSAFNYASLFVVSATIPSDQVPVTSGQQISSTLVNDQQSHYRWVTGPSREFLFHSSNRFQFDSLDAYGTRVTSYWLPEHEEAGRAALQHTAAALRVYSDWFGPYPFTDLRVATAPLSFRGMEYPQVFLLGLQLYDRYRDQLEIRTVHEVAHQWWYQIVHNDPVNQPWIDEGLAEYSSRIYNEAVRGLDAADILESRRWQAVVDRLVRRDEDAPLNQPVMAFANATQYEGIVYGKGALFFSAIRRSLGDRAFKQFLQNYLTNNQYKIVTPQDLLAELRLVNPQVADVLYAQWIGLPTPTAEPVQDLLYLQE